MNTNAVDVELFLRGAEELDRQRAAIRRVMGFLDDCIVPFRDVFPQKVKNVTPTSCRLVSLKLAEDRVPGRSGTVSRLWVMVPVKKDRWLSGTHELPNWAVKDVYNSLASIIQAVDKACPGGGILDKFDIICKLAPDNK